MISLRDPNTLTPRGYCAACRNWARIKAVHCSTPSLAVCRRPITGRWAVSLTPAARTRHRCRQERPQLRPLASGAWVRCHFAEEIDPAVDTAGRANPASHDSHTRRRCASQR